MDGLVSYDGKVTHKSPSLSLIHAKHTHVLINHNMHISLLKAHVSDWSYVCYTFDPSLNFDTPILLTLQPEAYMKIKSDSSGVT